MEKLIKELEAFKKQLPQAEQQKLSDELLSKLYSVYPFNKFEYVISHLIANRVIDLQEYLRIRSEYLTRNKYLHLFEIAPRTFGETWGQQHLTELVPEFQHPSPTLDPNYVGQYDLWLDGIRVEVKASRAVKRVSGATLTEKALSSGSNAKFDMNFQQIKPACCDVFVWIAVWRDKIDYWVFTSKEVEENKYYSHGQHRGNVGEGQLWIKDSNYQEFEPYKVQVHDLYQTVLKKGGKV